MFAAALAVMATPIAAQPAVDVISDDQRVDFPDEIVFTVELRSESTIEEAEVLMRLGSSKVVTRGPLDFSPGRSVIGSFAMNIRGDGHIPPGTNIRYRYRIVTEDGEFETEDKDWIYLDPRFEWQEIEEGIFSVLFHDASEDSARRVLEAIVSTNAEMGSLLDVAITRRTKAVMYNSKTEMDPALRFRSDTTVRELVTEGVAYSDFDLFLTLGSDPDIVAHEFTHLLVGKAADNSFGGVPAWINEGLAVYAQGGSDSYQRYLDLGIRRDGLIPLRGLEAPPGQPDQVLQFYGQGWSAMSFLIDEFGVDALQTFLAAIKAGRGTDSALRQAVGMSLDEFDNAWRASIGARPLPGAAPPPPDQARPPQPAPTPPRAPETERTTDRPAATPAARTDTAGDSQGLSFETGGTVLIVAVLALFGLMVVGVVAVGIGFVLRRD